jgi:hypothetical protein
MMYHMYNSDHTFQTTPLSAAQHPEALIHTAVADGVLPLT